MERRSFALTLKELDTSTGTITGYGAVFGNVDDGGDVIRQGAFARTLKERKGEPVPMLWQHETSDPIGVWSELVEDGHGLRCKGQLTTELAPGGAPAVPLAYTALAAAKHGSVRGLSIGYLTDRERMSTEVIDGQTVRVIEDLDLFELSLVTLPMNRLATINDAKSAEVRAALKTLALVRSGLDFHEATRLAQDFGDPEISSLDDLDRRIRAFAR
jgi:hypothetical protein